MVVGAILMYGISLLSIGRDAEEKARIKTVVEEMLITDSGQSHAAVLSTINSSLGRIETEVGRNSEELSDIRQAVLMLAADGDDG